MLKTAASREAAAPKLLPLLQRTRTDVSQLATALPPMAEQLDGAQIQLLALESALGDQTATDQINAMLASKDPAQAARGQAHLLMARFYITPNSAEAMTALTGNVEKADRAAPKSVPLTQTTIEMGHEAPLPAIGSRLLDIAANDMDNPVAGLLRETLNAKKEADAQDAQLANKPITLAGALARRPALFHGKPEGQGRAGRLLGHVVRPLQGRAAPREKDLRRLPRQRARGRRHLQ